MHLPRSVLATMTPAGGSAIQLVSNQYDTTPNCAGAQGLSASSAQWMHDSTYGLSWPYRGNLTQTSGIISSVPGEKTCFAYDTAGVAVQTIGPTGLAVTVQTGSSTNYSLPSVITPNNDSNLATTISYASSFAVTQVTAGTGASSSTTYVNGQRILSIWSIID